MPELPRFELLELSAQERQAFLGRVAPGCTVSEADYRLIEGMTLGLPDLLALIARQGMTIGRLRQSLFGPRTEKTTATVGSSSQAPMPSCAAEPKPKPLGHGRYGAGAYAGAQRIRVAHPHLQPGDRCPDCQKAKLYPVHPSGVALRIVGQAPLAAKLFELEKLRCAACGKLYTAPPPEEAGSAKYDESVGVLVALLRFGSGVPFYRLAKLQHTLGIPLPSSVQWALVYALYQIATPVLECLIHQAAQRSILHNDDTSMRVASLRLQAAPPSEEDDLKGARTGVFTTAILTDGEEPPIALFITGRQHAGENLHDLLGHRAAQLPPPVQMCDGLSRNQPKDFQTLLSNCLAHGRRQVIEVAPSFPVECRHILESLREVYRNDARARTEKLTPEQRLRLHQELSQPLMDQLHRWLQEQIEHKKVEPNSGLGGAIEYLLKRWEALTLFLRVPGAPLDNNLCERGLKMAILHRKNSLSYKTERGARVGDLFMSLIHTCRLNAINPFDYLLALARHPRQVAHEPERWLPWTYREAMAADTS